MRAKIFFHGSCFDGATSAALFAAFYRDRHPGATVDYQAMAHSATDPFRDAVLDGDDNICVDFRYCADPRMNWWFDHHVSAFQPRELREHYEASASEQKIFDPTSRSCAVLIDTSLRERFGFAAEGETWADLVAWADKIDGAQFKSAREAVELQAPALEITTWLAHFGDRPEVPTLIELLGKRPLAEIASEPWIREPLAPVLVDHARMIELIGERATVDGGVAFYDLADDNVAVHNKFIAYMLFPTARYTVGITRSAQAVKISVGSNPWAPRPRSHDIAAICERYGGGGHPVVGAVALAFDDLEGARRVASQICEKLRA